MVNLTDFGGALATNRLTPVDRYGVLGDLRVNSVKTQILCSLDRKRLIGCPDCPGAYQVFPTLETLGFTLKVGQGTPWETSMKTGIVEVDPLDDFPEFTAAKFLGHFRLHRVRYEFGEPTGFRELAEAVMYACEFLVPKDGHDRHRAPLEDSQEYRLPVEMVLWWRWMS